MDKVYCDSQFMMGNIGGV